MSTNVYLKSGEQPRYFRFGDVNYTDEAADSDAIYKESPFAAFQAIVSGDGSVTASVDIQISNEEATGTGEKANWITMATIALSGTDSATDGFTTLGPWRFVRASVTAVSGTGAKVEVIMGV